jgi:selenocysteine-specific elongation factor
MPLIGTAGHVDHGKSSLIQELTGRDPDRWAEEKRRGLTIDLGFSWTDLGDGVEVSFVDVPGHERFLKNMLAGVEAIDVALFVVAANEGWMPQSEEHLAVLDLLGVRAGVVALTKVDLVDADMVELVALEVADRLAGTTLEEAEVVPVSSLTGYGLDTLRASLSRSTQTVRSVPGRPRMWVDRVFSISGTGTVVTGSLLGGSLAVGDEIAAYPGMETARIRTIQSHEKPLEAVQPGRRVALGLAGIAPGSLQRGSMLGQVGKWRSSDRFSASLRRARYIDELPDRGAYQLHVGSHAQNAIIERQANGHAVIRLESAIPLAMGDRFILRDSGRRIVAAGGRVLDPRPGGGRAALEEATALDPDALPDDRASQLLTLRGIDRPEDLEIDSDGGQPREALQIAGYFLTPDTYLLYEDRAVALVLDEHATKPLHAGLPLATLIEKSGLPTALMEEIALRSERIELRGSVVAVPHHKPALPPELASSWNRARAALGESLAVPTVSELGLPAEAIHLLAREGDLTRIGPDFVFLPDQVDRIVATVARLEQPFGVGDVKEALGLSRKYVMPILEWLDSNEYTARRGDGRILGARLPGNHQ